LIWAVPSLSSLSIASAYAPRKNKKADVTERPKAFHHVGLLANEPPGMAEMLFI
jgi:hypothetical protein